MKTLVVTTALAVFCSISSQIGVFAETVNQRGQWQGPPALETFSTYEDMQRYFDSRKHRSLRWLNNPTDDSYIDAYNQHNEEEIRAEHKRTKRDPNQRVLPTEPKMFRFEISDAVEPSEEVKALIRKHRSRELRLLEAEKGKTTSPAIANGRQQKVESKKRAKRATQTLRQPANFQVKMISFEASDAREPDERTKDIIKRMRALETTRQGNTSAVPIGKTPNANSNSKKAKTTERPKNDGLRVKIKRRRVRRSAPKTQPQMIKFELEDAREPDESTKSLLKHNQNFRESKDLRALTLLTMEQKANQTKMQAESKVDSSSSELATTDDSNIQETKRYYVFKESPTKSKKSINSLPHEVQKVITHLLKENSGAKAYVKYIPAHQMDYSNLKAAYSSKLPYGAKLQPAAYAKYVHQPMKKVEPQQIQAHPVPVVEKVRYVYAPVATAGYVKAHDPHTTYAHQGTAAISHPIVVSESTAHTAPAPTEIHHTYVADLTHAHNDLSHSAQVIQNIPAPHFRPSKPDPLLEENKGNFESKHETSIKDLQYSKAYTLPVENYKYEIYPQYPAHEAPTYGKPYYESLSQKEEATTTAPVIKIEYHAPAETYRDNYKELQEYKELATLMGKSPEDQIHELTYLLAKEMQNKLHLQRQQKKLEEGTLPLTHRPQDNTAPMIFPGEQTLQMPPSPPIQPGKLIGMATTKHYTPIVENTASEETKPAASEEKAVVEVKLKPKIPAPSSYVGYGLSPNYEGITSTKTSHVIHHPTITHHGLIGVNEHHQHTEGSFEHLSNNKMESGAGDHLKPQQSAHYGLHHGDTDDLQYASKYAFGYRIRDFHTGNDFGHKQNRDLDGVTRGQYHILLPDGRIQNVVYHADDTGFHADVSFESGH